MNCKDLLNQLSVIKFKLENKLENMKLDNDKEIQGYFKELTEVEMKLKELRKELYNTIK